MINYIFKTKENINNSSNEFLPINDLYNIDSETQMFGVFSKTNVFIGENNSGKSMFLRSLFHCEPPLYTITNEELNGIVQELENYISTSSYPEYKKFNNSLSKFSHFYKTSHNQKSYYINTPNHFFKSLLDCPIAEFKKRFYFPAIRGVKNYKEVVHDKLTFFLQNSMQTAIVDKSTVNHFVDSLNHKTDGLDNFDIYQNVIYNEHFKSTGISKDRILTGGSLYYEIRKMLLGKKEDRETIKDFQAFLSENFYANADILLTPREDEKVLYLTIDKDDRPIHKWGDGVQQIIVMLYSLYKHRKEEDLLFFIEEPELYMHPGLLRKFIEVISIDSKFKNHQYFITTHSNITLDVSADFGVDMSIFKFKKVKDQSKNNNKQFFIEQCNHGSQSLLNELGIRNSSVFLSNCSIWVEGITDRLYIKHFLKLYHRKFPNKKMFKENLDYTFIEYAGSNIKHFNFENVTSEASSDTINAKFINNKIFLLADNDFPKEGSEKAKRHANLKEILKDNFCLLQVREIENMVSKEMLVSLLKKQNNKPSEHLLINDKSIKINDYRTEKLGNYIDRVFKDSGIKKYAGKYGEIGDKQKFCNDIIDLVTDYDLLTEEAKNLTTKIYKFIFDNNNI